MHTFVSVHSTHSKGELVVREVRVIAPLRNKTADALFAEIDGGHATAAPAATSDAAQDGDDAAEEEEETDDEEEDAWDGDTDEDAWDGE